MLEGKTDRIGNVPAVSGKLSVVESLSSLIVALDPLLLLPTFHLSLGFKKSSFPSPLYSGIAEIHSFAMIDDLLDPRPRFPLLRFLIQPGVHNPKNWQQIGSGGDDASDNGAKIAR